MASRVTPPTEEEGVEVDRAEEAGGVTVLVRGHFGRSWASPKKLNVMEIKL